MHETAQRQPRTVELCHGARVQGLQEGLALLLQRAANAGRCLGAGSLGGAAERLRLVQQVPQLAQPQLRVRRGPA